MRVGFRQLQLGDAVQFWNSTAPEPWHIDLAALTSCVVGCPCFDWGASAAWVVDGEIQALAWVKKSAARAYRGPDPDASHLSAIAFRDAPAAADLLADLECECPRNGKAHNLVPQFLQASANGDAQTAGGLLSDLHSERVRADYRIQEIRVETLSYAQAGVETASAVLRHLEAFRRACEAVELLLAEQTSIAADAEQEREAALAL